MTSTLPQGSATTAQRPIWISNGPLRTLPPAESRQSFRDRVDGQISLHRPAGAVEHELRVGAGKLQARRLAAPPDQLVPEIRRIEGQRRIDIGYRNAEAIDSSE
jgi:hypothetical protein